MSDNNPAVPGLVDSVERVHSGAASAEAVVTAQLERIGHAEPRLGCYIRVTAERALEQARAVDRAIARGSAPDPLAGAAIAVKDIFDVAGLPTTAGMAIHQESCATNDATVIARLGAAGAALLGKLTLTEGVYAEHRPPFPPPLNPWHADYWSGASSSGSGVAVAAGLCHAALGSETGGSIRLPAAANGVTAIKPTWGRVSRHGVFELAATLDHVGPLGRSVSDVAALLGVIAGADARDPTASLLPVPDYRAACGHGISRLRIGITPRDIAATVDRETAAALDAACGELVAAGAVLREIALPDVRAMIDDWFPVCAVQTAHAHAATFPSRRTEYGPALAALLELGATLSGIDYQKLLLRRLDFRGRLDAVFESVDLIALPVLAFPVPSLARMTAIDEELIAGLHRFTCPYNLSGHPAIVLPCGMNSAGLPIVFQLIGRHFDEALLIATGYAYQQATDWHSRRPLDP